MKDANTTSNPLEGLLKSLPEAAKNFKQEADNIGRALLDNQLKKADIVTREEFEEQKLILKAALEKLSRIEQLLNAQNANNEADNEQNQQSEGSEQQS